MPHDAPVDADGNLLWKLNDEEAWEEVIRELPEDVREKIQSVDSAPEHLLKDLKSSLISLAFEVKRAGVVVNSEELCAKFVTDAGEIADREVKKIREAAGMDTAENAGELPLYVMRWPMKFSVWWVFRH